VTHRERIVPSETSPGIVALHLKRYEFARPWCEGADVLDAGCGVGYGAAYLAPHARTVVGLDRAEEAIAVARSRYTAPNTEYVEGDLLALPFPDAAFDVVCAFETIEHVDDPAAMVAEAARVLRTDGRLIASTPHVLRTDHEPANPFHRVELAPADFEALLRRSFGTVELYGERRAQTRRHGLLQRLDVLGLRRRVPPLRIAERVLGTPAMAHLELSDVIIDRTLAGASVVVAVCTAPQR
jgi:SAM-dependent methyltransferase